MRNWSLRCFNHFCRQLTCIGCSFVSNSLLRNSFLSDGFLCDSLLRCSFFYWCFLFGSIIRFFGSSLLHSLFYWLWFFRLHIAHKAFALRLCAHTICLLLNNCRGLCFYTNAHLAAQIKGLLIGHAELFSKLMNAQDLGQVLFPLTICCSVRN
jgi:hypothetical protein